MVETGALQRPRNEVLSNELQSLLEVLAAKQPGINTLKAKRLQRKFALVLRSYFVKLGRQFPFDAIPSFIEQYGVVKEAAEEDAARIVGNHVGAASGRLDFVVRDYLERGYILGANQAQDAVKIKATFALVDDGAVQWMTRRAASSVTGIDDVTRRRLAKVLVQGAKKGESVAKIARNLRAEVAGWADVKVGTGKTGRALMIAQNELNESMSESSLSTYKRLGIGGKSWSTALDPEEICEANESQGVIPVGGVFQSGHERPPAHPGCLCTLTPEAL